VYGYIVRTGFTVIVNAIVLFVNLRSDQGWGRNGWGSLSIWPSLVRSWVARPTFISQYGSVGALFLTSQWAHVALAAMSWGGGWWLSGWAAEVELDVDAS